MLASLTDRLVTEGASFKDGWRLTYASPGVHLTVEYLDVATRRTT